MRRSRYPIWQMIRRLQHVQITIPKGAEAEGRKFYCELLGLREVPKPEPLKGRGGFWLQLGETQIHVGTEEGVERATTKAHVAYEVDDLDELQAGLENAGIKISRSIPLEGFRRFEIRDPFGNRVEFLQRTS